MKNKTWEEFWGEFLQVTFHSENPELWPFRQKKALWFLSHCSLKPGAKILDLGCGDGLIDIWLSRMGFDVIAVDRNKTVLDIAHERDDTESVTFIPDDLRKVDFPDEHFDAILLIETLGLMSKKDDAALIAKTQRWLKPSGFLILDCPESAEDKNSWTKEFSDGTASGVSSFNREYRLHNIEFFFEPNGEERFGIFDPYDKARGNNPGIVRYLYPKAELIEILSFCDFAVSDIDHYYSENYYGLSGQKLKKF